MKQQRAPRQRTALQLSADRKVTPIAHETTSGWRTDFPNSFGLPAGVTCPGRTPFCDSCYGAAIERRPNVAKLLARNYELLLEAGTVDGMFELLHTMMLTYQHHANEWRLRDDEWLFRIHWDGDFFSIDYAHAWRRVIDLMPHITFWVYTRSFHDPVNVIPILAGAENLMLYLSVDEHNVAAARRIIPKFHPPLALCAEDYRQARDLLPERIAPVICPENARRIPLVNDEGVGACMTCRVCPSKRRDVLFATSRQEDVRSWVEIHGHRDGVCDHCGKPATLRQLYCCRQCQVTALHRRQRLAKAS